jgi:hypothetical protein
MTIASGGKAPIDSLAVHWPLASALIATAILFLCVGAADAAPKVIEERETAVLPAPTGFDPSFFFPHAMVMDGGRIMVSNMCALETACVFLYERNAAGRWTFVAEILRVQGEPNSGLSRLALEGDVLAVTFKNALHVVERIAGQWRHTAALSTPSPIRAMGEHVQIDRGTIVVAGESGRFQGVIFRKNAAGQWGYVAHVTGGPRHQDFGVGYGFKVDISGSTVAVPSPFLDLQTFLWSGSVFLFTEVNGVWTQEAEIRYPLEGEVPPGFGSMVELEGDTLVIDGHLFLRSGGAWTYATRIQSPDLLSAPGGLAIAGDLIAQDSDDAGRGFGGSILVYQRNGAEVRPVAQLYPSALVSSDPHVLSFSGRTVVAQVGDFARAIMRFELPADLSQPAIVQDDFQDGNANGWNPSNISDWSVGTAGGSRVYRQASFAAESHSVLTNAVWTNQSAQVDVTPTAIQGTNRFVGLAVRFKDASNYYYVALRSSSRLELRKKVNGTFITLASAPYGVALNQRYRLRVEAIGSRIRAYVNDGSMIEAVDRSHVEGSAALLTWGARANFDNVVVTPNPLRTYFADSFSDHYMHEWTKEFGAWVDPPEPVDEEESDPFAHLRNFAQTSTTGKGRATAGVSIDDMHVQARARATSALAPGAWFGVMARHIDDRNFYYLRLGDGRVSIRKFVNGSFFELAGAPFTVNSNVDYALRLEVVGTKLRGYVNDRPLLEASDSSHAAGRYGLATNQTAVRFDDVLVQQP